MSPRHVRGAALCALAVSLPAIGQEAPVQVQYVHAEEFADVGNRRFSDERIRAAYLEQLRSHLAKRAGSLLAAGERLSVSITEVDMAGEFEAWRPPSGEARIVKDIYPPRIDLRFRVSDADGRTVREGERTLRDSAFLMRDGIDDSDPLRFEKRLLDAWLRKEFTASPG